MQQATPDALPHDHDEAFHCRTTLTESFYESFYTHNFGKEPMRDHPFIKISSVIKTSPAEISLPDREATQPPDAPLVHTATSNHAAPFVIEHHQEDRALSGTFRPAARLILTPRVRTSGLWRALAPEDCKTLVLLLTFLTANGWCRPTLPELSSAMEVSHAKAQARMERLIRTHWQGQPLMELLPRPDGLDAYLPGRQLVAHVDVSPPEPPKAPPLRAAGREAVIAYSRARYAKTREEVEKQIGDMMGWSPPDFAGDDPAIAESKRRAYQAMTDIGMPKAQALDLLARFDLGAVERQISWLSQRHAKNPVRFLAAAIEGGYDRPLGLRRQASIGAEEAMTDEVRLNEVRLEQDASKQAQKPPTGPGDSFDE